MSVDEVFAWVETTGRRHVVVTGGEPMIQPEVEPLCRRLMEAGRHVTIETAGTVYRPVAMSLLSMSPKLANSTPWEREGGRFAKAHEERRLDFEAMQRLIDAAPEVQLKFVICQEADLVEVKSILARLRGWAAEDVLLMPEGVDAATLDSRAGWLAEVCKREGFRFCPRLHVHLYGSTRGT